MEHQHRRLLGIRILVAGLDPLTSWSRRWGEGWQESVVAASALRSSDPNKA